MWICKQCLKNNNIEPTIFQSWGVCEICNEYHDCSDIEKGKFLNLEPLGPCLNCGKGTNNKVRISKDDGFCQSSSSGYLCQDCHKPRVVGDNAFVKIKNKLYWEFNAYLGIFGCLEEIRTESRYEYLVNQGYYDMLNGVEFID